MEELYKKHYFGLKKFVSNRVDDEQKVEEIVNDVMLAVIINKPYFRGKSDIFSWICGIAKHKIVDYYRKKKLKTILFSVSPVFEEIADKALGPEKTSLKIELIEEIKKTLRGLKKEYYKVLRLKYIKGWRVNKIAQKLNISPKAVESRLQRAKFNFRELWEYDKKKN